MQALHLLLILLTSLIAAPIAQTNPTGTWKAEFTGPIGDRPKPFGDVVFRLRVIDGRLTGKAIMGNWPGEAPLTGTTFDGEHFSVTAIGTKGWTAMRVNHCCPKMIFEGTIHDDRMNLTMVWASTEEPADEAASQKKVPLVATKISNDPNATVPE